MKIAIKIIVVVTGCKTFLTLSKETDTHPGTASQAMAPRPPQANWNTDFQAPTCQYDMEQMQFESAGCVTTHANNSDYPHCTHKNNDFQSPNRALVEGDTPTNYWQMDQGEQKTYF